MKRTCRMAGALLALVLLGAAPADPLLARLLAGANAVQPATLDFERTSTVTETTSGTPERHVSVDRWDGRVWTQISIDGRPPTAKAAADAVKAASASGVPGYYRLARYLTAGPIRSVDAAGTITYRLAKLPAGSVSVKGASNDKFSAEFVVDTSGPIPFIRRARYFAPQPMRIMMVAKLDRFEALNDYRVNAGRPELVHSSVDLAGSLFGRSGTQHQEATYTYR